MLPAVKRSQLQYAGIEANCTASDYSSSITPTDKFVLCVFTVLRIDDFDTREADDQLANFGLSSQQLDTIVSAIRYARSAHCRSRRWLA